MKWRGLDPPGIDSCTWETRGRVRVLSGEARLDDGGHQQILAYRVECDSGFRTLRASVHGRIDGRNVDRWIQVRGKEWSLNGRPQPKVEGCVDLDLAFTPATNTLSIRRLRLEDGETGTVTAAWLRYPQMDLRPLEQSYHRLNATTYEYRSGDFSARLAVNRRGVVLRYGHLWKRSE